MRMHTHIHVRARTHTHTGLTISMLSCRLHGTRSAAARAALLAFVKRVNGAADYETVFSDTWIKAMRGLGKRSGDDSRGHLGDMVYMCSELACTALQVRPLPRLNRSLNYFHSLFC